MKNLNINYLFLTVLFSPALIGCVPLVAIGVGVGASTGAVISEDRRSGGIFIEDESIELKSARRINQQLGDSVHINVTSFNRIVLLTGEVPNETMKQQAEKLVMSIENVRNIVNEISISSKSSLASRSNDALITSKIKARFLSAQKFQINHIKVVTENQTVYLLGRVKRQEAESAAEIASSTTGVLKVVKVFEYLN
ncbi:Osmotically-inducible protein OsmY, contains BON domain [Nitrosomonas cryotolerans]|uniref:Osmotically-inducible protein OsmY, contains BON domain n=1 Tax=Nitrosomonas cryotolerans ATCC 49181 TaxID=1131553 RepID=A0A1N6GTR9_9PROT|nr:BON domain-containing protein [Nitrosomonas cryotolerans]SFP40921.1 Osmotically-inducible protein OsmY, contains BON domain [Nitrosomonas cryotolerans]SIO10991.1 Osmotically-inducible protein OsmY, contains BON domain [Nitrosomonas cryotolerans ATCC 49181]